MRRLVVGITFASLTLAACGGGSHKADDVSAATEPISIAGTTAPTIAPRVNTAAVNILLDDIKKKMNALPISYNGNQFPGGGNQSDIASQWSLGASDFHQIADGLRGGGVGAVTSDVLAAGVAVDSFASAVTAVSQCLATDDANFGGTKIIGATVCQSLSKELEARATTVGAAFAALVSN